MKDPIIIPSAVLILLLHSSAGMLLHCILTDCARINCLNCHWRFGECGSGNLGQVPAELIQTVLGIQRISH